MSELTQWIQELTQAVSAEAPQVTRKYARLLAPGSEPIDLQGFIRAEPKQTFTPFGETPVAFSVIEWFQAVRDAGPVMSDLPAEIGGLLSLVTDRRVVVLPEIDSVMEGTDTHLFVPFQQVIDARLVSPCPENLDINEQFKKRLTNLCAAGPKQQRALSEAISLHYGAVLLFERDIAAAYTLIVAGLESLSRIFGSPPTGWSKWDQADNWDSFMSTAKLSGTQKRLLRDHLMKDRHLRLKETFTNYVVTRLPDSFWEDEWSEWMYPVNASTGTFERGDWSRRDKIGDHVERDRELLRIAIRKSYDARSGFVHEGKRQVNFISQIYGLSKISKGPSPLPFAHLRSMLRCLILLELDQFTGTQLPNVEIHHPRAES